jgi:peptidoglycan/LPS O-acetylase OafA/YrhL
VLWQAIFILGLLLGFAWPKYNAISFKWKATLTGVCWLTAGILFIMEYGYQWGMQWVSFGTAFTKVPLSTPETLRYLSIIFGIITTTDLCWARVSSLAPSAFVQTLGKKSLPVYVVHLWIIQLATFLAARWTFMGNWQLLFAPVAILILWLFALILDVTSQPKKSMPATASIPGIFGPEPMPGTAR